MGDVAGFLEVRGFVALVLSMAISFLVGWLLIRYGRGTEIRLYRKEAMAVVGLSWILATVLGALPFWLRGTYRGPAVRLAADSKTWQVYDSENYLWRHWDTKDGKQQLGNVEHQVVLALYKAGAKGLAPDEFARNVTVDSPVQLLERLKRGDGDWQAAIIFPDEEEAPDARRGNYRLRWIRMGVADALFESQSGFSTTGATVLSDLEDPVLVPHCLLFWRSSTHFLGGLGIIVLFVAILGQGSAGKAMMRAEMPGPSKDGSQARMQQTAWLFAAIYCILNLVLTIILCIQGLSLFDALCHAFGTMATGGFSTWNKSLGHFDSAMIEYTVTLFMIIAGTNFTLLYFVAFGQFKRMFEDVEWRTYLGVIAGVTLLVVLTGLRHGNFEGPSEAIRYGLFQVVAIVTTTGFGTHDFDQWSSFGRGVLFLLMFVGGCAGSTGGGMKVIRHILFLKIMKLEIEQAFHPSVVRPLRLGGRPVEDPDLRKNILVYFGLILVIFVFSWMFVVAIEPDATWGTTIEHKLIDSASAVASTLNNIGPGLGTVGSTQNYGHFSSTTKFLFVWLMMIGRIEIFAILVLFMPSFWRNR
ncbi:MAG: TrkH family potassium uptake protein [Planctomycetes bacterium]|nr:TrkH family potassium uptake protein [Planctomycetota bacterium]